MQIEFTNTVRDEINLENNLFEFDQNLQMDECSGLLSEDLTQSSFQSSNLYDPVQISNDLENILIDLLEVKDYESILIFTGSDSSIPESFNTLLYQKFKSGYNEAISINNSILFYRYLTQNFGPSKFYTQNRKLNLTISTQEYFSKLSKKIQDLDLSSTTFSKMSKFLVHLKNHFESQRDEKIKKDLRIEYDSRFSASPDSIEFEKSSYANDDFSTSMYIKDEDVLGGSSVVSRYKSKLLADKNKSASMLAKKNISYEKAKSVLKTAGLATPDMYDILGKFSKIKLSQDSSSKQEYKKLSLAEIKMDTIEF